MIATFIKKLYRTGTCSRKNNFNLPTSRSLFLVLLLLATGCTDSSDTPPASVSPQRNGQDATLECSLQGDTLRVRLTNTGKKDLLIDRELVFLLHVVPLDTEGNVISVEQVEPGLTPSNPLMERIISLAPQQSIERIIELNKPFKVFMSGTSSDHTISAYEAFYALPKDRPPAKIDIIYGVGHAVREGFWSYVGEDSTAIGLFDGPLECEVLVSTEQ